MSDQLEERLRTIYAEHSDTDLTEASARLRRCDYQPAPAGRRSIVRSGAWNAGEHRLRLVSLGFVIAVLAGCVLAVTGTGTGPSIIAQASAATYSNGQILHYSYSYTEDEPFGLLSSTGESGEVWSTTGRAHVLGTDFGTNRRTGHRSTNTVDYSESPSLQVSYANGVTTRDPAAQSACQDPLDSLGGQLGRCGTPVTVLQKLLTSGALHSAGRVTEAGRALDVLQGSPEPPTQIANETERTFVAVYVDPKTFEPVEVQLTRTFTGDRRQATQLVVLDFSAITRLPMSAANTHLLLMNAHPGSRIINCSDKGICNDPALAKIGQLPLPETAQALGATHARLPAFHRLKPRFDPSSG